MLISDFDFHFPPELVALEPSRPTRVAYVEGEADPVELTLSGLLDKFAPADLLVMNQSRVIPARIFSREGIEILFLRSRSPTTWEVLFPARDFKPGSQLSLPANICLTLLEKGLPQIVTVSAELNQDYFERHGEYALPPYIQQARGERHNRSSDRTWYQTSWAVEPGSVAAPTASLHFQPADLAALQAKGVNLAYVTLHVGAGTFLPVRASRLDDHQMHAEWVKVPHRTAELIKETRQNRGRVWALGTTVTRALESMACGLLQNDHGDYCGETRLFIKPGDSFRVVDALLTNFHQPKSTLLCLVSAFAGLDQVKKTYRWAIERQFRLFSYGDLSAWTRRL